jgi:hypothetical protein
MMLSEAVVRRIETLLARGDQGIDDFNRAEMLQEQKVAKQLADGFSDISDLRALTLSRNNSNWSVLLSRDALLAVTKRDRKRLPWLRK